MRGITPLPPLRLQHDIVVTVQRCGRFEASVTVDGRLNVSMVQDATDFFVMAGVAAGIYVRRNVTKQMRIDLQTENSPNRGGNVSANSVSVLGCV